MTYQTRQLDTWTRDFGRQYTDRNTLAVEELDRMYRDRFGTTRTEMNKAFLEGIDRSARILEVGANTGNQLLCLKVMGFTNLYGIEPQEYAVETAKQRTAGINLIRGSAFDLPFKDGYFDLVFTSGVLIHISPADIKKALAEIHRCSGRYIWGFEYYAERHEEIVYRGEKDLLWKADFASLYTASFPNLELVRQTTMKYNDSGNRDAMYLLRKK